MIKIKQSKFKAKIVSILVLSLVILNCDSKPTLDECRVSLARFLYFQLGKTTTKVEINKLVTEDPISIKMTNLCMKNKSRKQVECEMSAANIEEMRSCSKESLKN